MQKLLTHVSLFLFAVAILPLTAATYKEAAGRVVIEAEHFDSRTTNSANHAFLIVPTEDPGSPSAFVNARADLYLQVLPDSGAGATTGPGGVGIDPSVNFKVHIDNPGYYQLYLRWGGWDGASDSLYARVLGISDDVGGILPDWYRYARTLASANDFAGGWHGIAGFERTDAGGGDVPAVWYIGAAGDYTIQLSQREDGAAIDALVFQLSNLAAPGEPGPPESDIVGTDTKPPVLVEALTAGNPNGLLVIFNEGVSPATGTNTNNYAIDNGVTVNSVSPGLNTYSVVLNTTAITPGRAYNLTVNGVQDAAGNTVAANTKVQFHQVDGFIERRVFDVTGGTLPNITNSAKFINNLPDAVTYPTLFEGPVDYRDNYGTQFRGYITPPTNGNYVFFVCSDDNSNLFLSTDESPANKKLIAVETVWSTTRQWVTSAGASVLESKRSDQYAGSAWTPPNVITLVGGRRYYIEAIQAEGGGGDNIAVTWTTPLDAGDPVDGASPIPGKYLSGFGFTPGPVSITTQPASQTATELLPVTFRVTPGGSPPYNFQWLRNGAVIIGATSQSYTIPRTALTDSGAKFSVRIFNLFSAVVSSEASLTVTTDTTPPVMLGAKGNPNQTEVVVTFSERVSAASATNAANYQISSASGSLSVTAAALSTDSLRVTLTTAQQTLGTKYTITVNNVTDLAATPNVIAPNSKVAFLPVGKIAQDASGLVVFEAENYDRNLDNLWIRDTARGNPSGGVSMVCPTGGGEFTTQLEYDVNFRTPGTYIIWYHASGNDGGSDSGWFHIDGDKPTSPDRTAGNASSMTGFSGALDFVWLSNPQDGGGQFTFDVATAGNHIIGVGRRENNAFFDKFIITPDPAYVPTGFGPPETREGLVGPPSVSITSPTNGQIFATGASVTLTANATSATNTIAIARVEFTASGTKIGEANTSPFTFTWNNVPQGSYTLRAIATDEVGGVTTSAPVPIKVGTPPPTIYFVTADPGPLTFAGDIAVYQRLLNRGFNVELARGSDVPGDGSSALGKDLIIQSSSLGSGTVENNGIGKFRFLAIPAIVWESSSEDAFAFQELNGATTADQTQINIVDSTSPLAAGFTNGLVTTSTAEPYSQGTPTGAHIVATLAGDPSQAVIYYYEKGDKGFNDFVMPARRVFFFFGDNTASVATADGLKLFDAAVDWAANIVVSAKPTLGVARQANGSVTITFTGRLESTDSLTTPNWQTVPGTGSVNVQTTGQGKFYRAANP